MTTSSETEGRATFTPGEWSAWQSPDGEWVIRAVYNFNGMRHTAFPAVCNAGAQNNEANARLIAASPMMLKALQKIADESVFNQLRYAEDTETDYFLRCFRAVKEAARAAIAVATGAA